MTSGLSRRERELGERVALEAGKKKDAITIAKEIKDVRVIKINKSLKRVG